MHARWKSFAPRQKRGLLLAALIAAAVYVGVRAIPQNPCPPLHYDTQVNAEGLTEVCGNDQEPSFVDLDAWQFPVTVDLDFSHPPSAGQPTQLTLTLSNYQGQTIGPADLVLTHTRLLHLLLVSDDLADYQHLHPEPTGRPGEWAIRFTPRTAGSFRAYLDFVPKQFRGRVLTAASFTVAGEPVRLASPDHSIQLHLPAEGLRPGKLTQIEVRIPGEHQLGLVMGALAHVVVFDARRTGFAHLHPLDDIYQARAATDSNLRFSFLADKPGRYRLWVQMLLDGAEVFQAFDLLVSNERA